MKQRIEVRSLVKKDGRILLLKRGQGREDLLGKYELPGGRVEPGEQPEEAVKRLIGEETGLGVHTSYLSDVFTYIDPDGSNTFQRAVIVYVSSISGDRGDIKVDAKHSRYTWKKITEIQQDEVTELAFLLLSMHKEKPGVSVTAIEGVKIQSDVSYREKARGGISVYSDGGSRGNPGPSAAGYIIKDENDKLAYEGGVYLGITTNNQAEYHGVRLGLEKAKEMGVKSVDCYIDSMLVVNQLNGQYVIRNRELWPIHERIKELMNQFDKVAFRHVKREFNQQADGMVNKILDARAKKEVTNI